MADEPSSAAALFEDDLMKIIMARLSVRLIPHSVNGQVQVQAMLVDNKTGFASMCTGERLTLGVSLPYITANTSY